MAAAQVGGGGARGVRHDAVHAVGLGEGEVRELLKREAGLLPALQALGYALVYPEHKRMRS